jgi:hypothetical protein
MGALLYNHGYHAMRRSAGHDPNSLATLANVGRATLGDLALLGIRSRAQLARRDAYRLYERLCAKTGARHDPSGIDVFLAAISQSKGNPPRDWWSFTPERKRALAEDPSRAPSATRTASSSRSRRDPAARAARAGAPQRGGDREW